MPALDLTRWPRRAIHDFYRSFEDPWFNLTTEVEVGHTRHWCTESEASFALACWFAVLRAAEAEPALRMRLRPDGVWLHDTVRVGATVMKPDDSFTYAWFPAAGDFPTFAARARAEIERRVQAPGLEPDEHSDDVLHCTMIPWVRFTAIKHARRGGEETGIPRIALGRVLTTDTVHRMPVSVEAHHALVDGLHVGRFFEAFQDALAHPRRTFG